MQGCITAAVKFLKRVSVGRAGMPFTDLSVSTVQGWYMKDVKPLTLRLAIAALMGNEDEHLGWRLGQHHGKSSFESRHPEVMVVIMERLRALRVTGCVVTSQIVAAQFQIAAKEMCPEEIHRLQFGERWCRDLVRLKMQWTFRRATGSSTALSEDWQEQRDVFIQRVCAVYLCEVNCPDLVVNADHTGMRMLPNGRFTYDKCGTQHVKIVGRDDKRQVMVVVGSTFGGMMLPFQVSSSTQATFQTLLKCPRAQGTL